MVIVITGLTNAGKSTLTKRLIEAGYPQVLEYTTRPIREGEKDDVDYHFVDDAKFDEMYEAGEFAETLFVNTVFGLWKYGARKEDLKDGYVLSCGTHQMHQLLETDVAMLSVLLDIDKETAKQRAIARGSQGDSLAEFERRFAADEVSANELRGQMAMVLPATNTVEVNLRAIDNRYSLERFKEMNGITEPKKEADSYEKLIQSYGKFEAAQPLSDADKYFYLSNDTGLIPYLRMYNNGMPQNPIDQIAWLLLQGSGCGFCKICCEKPCDIKDGEKCTTNIANYIRECVHVEMLTQKNRFPETPVDTGPFDKEWLKRLNESMWWSSGNILNSNKSLYQKSTLEKYRELHKMLLKCGGHETCFAWEEPDLDTILEKALFLSSNNAVLEEGEPSRCHANAAKLWRKDPENTQIWTGYALSSDGMWRQHSWAVREGVIIETTVSRAGYFGFPLSKDEAENFCLTLLDEV